MTFLKIQVGSKEVRARQYPWGVVQVKIVSLSSPLTVTVSLYLLSM